MITVMLSVDLTRQILISHSLLPHNKPDFSEVLSNGGWCFVLRDICHHGHICDYLFMF